MHFVSLNVRGIRNKQKRNKILLWLRQQKSDVIFLQETFLSKDLEKTIYAEWNGPCYFNHGSHHSRGVAILIRKNLNLNVHNVYHKYDGRIIGIRISIEENNYLCILMYMHQQKAMKRINFTKC